MDPKRIAEILADLANASEADIRAALAALGAQGRELAANPPTAKNVEALEKVAADAKSLSAALTEKAELAGKQTAALAELDGVHDPARDHVEQPTEENTADVPKPEEAGATTDPGADVEKPDGGDGKGKPPAKKSRTASGLGKIGKDGSPEQDGPKAGVVQATTTVAAGVPGFSPGQQLTEDAFVKAFAAVARSKGNGSANIAHVEFAYPPERTLGDDTAVNQARIAAATDEQAIVAAGGLCLPPEVRYDINVLGVTDRPVHQALNTFRTERGILQYRAPFDALAMNSGLGIWTQADDQAVVIPPPDPDTNPYKSCYVVSCPGVLEASIYSTYMCLEFPNMTARFDTEWVRATTQAAQIAWARYTENNLLSRLFSASKILKGMGPAVSAVADLLATYDRVIAYYRNRHRLNSRVTLRTIMPQWVINLLQTDLARRFTMASPGELFGIAQAELERWFSTRGVNVTWHLDGLAGATVSTVVIDQQFYDDTAAGQVVPAYPDNVDSLLFVEGDWLLLDGGTLDLGLVRDSELNKRNRYQTFVETFEGVAFTGKESLRVVLPLRPDGSAAGTKAVPAGGWDA